MKKIVFLMAFFAAVLGAAEWKLDQVSVLTLKSPSLSQTMATEELKLHLELLAGKITSGETFKMYVGIRPPDTPNVKPFESVYKIENNTVYFYGDDGSAKKPRNGTLFAVYGFLQDQLGVRWPRPGNDWIVFNPRRSVTLPDSLINSYIPPLEMSVLRNYGWGRDVAWNDFVPDELKTSETTAKQRVDERAVWLLRMRHATRRVFRYGHAFRSWWQRFSQTHPEYFGLNPYGKRGLSDRQAHLVKLCLSNPAVIDQIIADYVEQGKPKYLNICPNDGTPGYCFCTGCMELDSPVPGEPFYVHKTDRFLNFWNRVAARAVALRPDVTIVTYIYSYYRFPPRRETIAYPDNMLFGMVPSMHDDIRANYEGWKKAGMKHSFLRPNFITYSGVLPRGMERFLYDSFHMALEFNSIGVDYDATLGRRPMDMETYLIARMIAEPQRSFDDLSDEYFSLYGAAAPEVKNYYQRIGERGAKALARNKMIQKKTMFLMTVNSVLIPSPDTPKMICKRILRR